ncbi:MAG: hypothetical protein J0L53_03555 [Spirochaetes bacterium]|nr:hypothetical protein [Spirochaetota bacterium]
MKKIWMLLPLSFFALHCSGDLPLSDLINNTVTLKMLGTYESNDPYGSFSSLYKADVFNYLSTAPNPALNGSQLESYATSIASAPSNLYYYIDIAEVRIAEGQGKSSSQTISDYWSQFAISRQLMCSSYATADNRTLANCSDSNGIQRLTDFFNGGFTYPAVDVASGFYKHLGIYFRRFATSPAAIFTGDGAYGGGSTNADGTWAKDGNVTSATNVAVTTFDNRSIYGFDVEGFLQNQYGETATEPRMFPLQRKDLSLRVTNGAEPYVLEVRVFLKNAMMVHLRQLTQNTSIPASISNVSAVYVAPSDWNITHMFTETDSSGNSGKQGGSLLMTARTYQPANVGSIVMSSTVGGGSDYFAVVAAGSTFPGQAWVDSTSVSTAVLPLAATKGTNTRIANLPPGTYDVYRTCDIYKCSRSSTGGYCDVRSGQPRYVPGTPDPDGYPETAVKCASSVTVSKGTSTSVSISSCSSATATVANPCFVTGFN